MNKAQRIVEVCKIMKPMGDDEVEVQPMTEERRRQSRAKSNANLNRWRKRQRTAEWEQWEQGDAGNADSELANNSPLSMDNDLSDEDLLDS
eukprot:m.421169 g.421169  ORF g.421169 m.421169 type:complete len:91 (-) comp20194_c0_seq6:68-340(-)